MFIVPKERWIDLSLPNEIGGDKRKDVEAGWLVISELNHAEEDQESVMIWKQPFQGKHVLVHLFIPIFLLELAVWVILVRLWEPAQFLIEIPWKA